MSSVKTSTVRCRHCETSFRIEAVVPGTKITCPSCGRTLVVGAGTPAQSEARLKTAATAPKPGLSDDDVLGFLQEVPAGKNG